MHLTSLATYASTTRYSNCLDILSHFILQKCVLLEQYSSTPSYDIKGNWFQLPDHFLYQNVICLVITLQDLHQSSLAGYVKIKSHMYIKISTCRRSIKVHRWNSRNLNPNTKCNTVNSVTLQPLHPTEEFKQDSEFAPELYGDYVSGANGIRHGGEGSSRG
jgi:hypothetical protein